MKKQLSIVLLCMATSVVALAQTKPKKATPKTTTTTTTTKTTTTKTTAPKTTTSSKTTTTTQHTVAAKRKTVLRGFNEGDNLLNVGVGIGSPFFGAGYSSSLPINPSISYEHGFTNEISVGAQVAYASSKYSVNFPGSNYNFKENAIYIGARGSYHFNELLELDPKFDVYGGASIGYVIVNVSDNQGFGGTTGSGLGFGLFAGGKYYFSSSTGVFAEVGYQSLALLNVGVAFKF